MASVDTTLTTGNLNFPKGRAFSTWLTAVGAQSAPGELALTQARRDIGALNAPATEWLRNAAAPGETFFFSFNTPLPSSAPAATACGRVMFSDFHASAGDVVDVAAAGACHSDADCGYGASCAPTSLGACTPLSCLVDADCGLGNTCAAGGMCAPTPCDYSMPCRDGEICTSGLCTGCLDATYCPSGECSRSAPSTCTTFANAFPYACLQGPLTPQEQALEFLLLDLTNCISPDDSTPPIPASLARPANTVLFSYAESTFTEDFSADCPDGTRVVWRELDWSSVVPDTASIAFSVQTAAFAADGGSPDWAGAEAVALPTDTTGTANGYSLIDTVMLLGDGGPVPATTVAGAFNQASPPVVSRANLRLTVTLNPTTDRTAAPTLLGWSVKSDCLPSE